MRTLTGFCGSPITARKKEPSMRRRIRRLSMQDPGEVTSQTVARRRKDDAAGTSRNPEVRQETLSTADKEPYVLVLPQHPSDLTGGWARRSVSHTTTCSQQGGERRRLRRWNTWRSFRGAPAHAEAETARVADVQEKGPYEDLILRRWWKYEASLVQWWP